MLSKPEKLGSLSNCPKSGNPAKTFSKDVGWRRMTGWADSRPNNVDIREKTGLLTDITFLRQRRGQGW